MNLSHGRRRSFVVPTVALLGASLLVLHLGGFIELDDTSGFGGNEWVRPLGFVAGLLAVASVGVATQDRVARRALGACLAVLDLLLVVLSVTDDGFRFIRSDDEGELFILQVVLAPSSS